MKNILKIGGWSMKVDDGSLFWTISGRSKECFETGRDLPTIDDLLWADNLVVYSYGCASLWKLFHELQAEAIGKTFDKLIIVAGVPDLWLGQFKPSLWHKPDFVCQAFCFQVNDIPISCDLREADASIDFGLKIPTLSCINIFCDRLFQGIMLPGAKHSQIKEHKDVVDSINRLLG